MVVVFTSLYLSLQPNISLSYYTCLCTINTMVVLLYQPTFLSTSKHLSLLQHVSLHRTYYTNYCSLSFPASICPSLLEHTSLPCIIPLFLPKKYTINKISIPQNLVLHTCTNGTAIVIIIEGHETAFNCFLYQFTTGKPLRNLKLTLNHYENGGTKFCMHELLCLPSDRDATQALDSVIYKELCADVRSDLHCSRANSQEQPAEPKLCGCVQNLHISSSLSDWYTCVHARFECWTVCVCIYACMCVCVCMHASLKLKRCTDDLPCMHA
jgi:hypothetical protein